MGKAIVAPAMDNLRDILQDGEEALLFEEESADALRAQLAKLLEDTSFASGWARRPGGKVER